VGETPIENVCRPDGPALIDPHPADAQYILWQAESEQFSVEIRKLTMEQIRQVCFAAAKGIYSGGTGIGGLLYGTLSENAYRILGWRPIEFRYPLGEDSPGSGADQLMFEQMLGEAPPDGTRLLGWFSSHPKGGFLLSPAESRIHSEFFSDEDRILLTIRPTRAGELVAVVHEVDAESDGLLRPCVPELRIQPLSGSELSAFPHADLVEPAASKASVLAAARSAYLAVGFSVLLVMTAALAVLGWELSQSGMLPSSGVFAARSSQPKRLLSVHARHASRRLDLEWDPRAYEKAKPSFATITLLDGSTERSLEIASGALKTGRASIALNDLPRSVTLLIRTASGGTFKETVRIVQPRALK